jgi:uncharacterized membrane protein SpoIIM required for sporulation
LAILAGFAGAWAGLQLELPGVPEAASSAAFAPLYLALLSRRGARLVALLALGWVVGIAGAVQGAVLDDLSRSVRSALPLGGAYRVIGLDPWLDPAAQPTAASVWIVCAWIVVTPALAWVSRGILSLLSIAMATGAVMAAAADWALRAVQAGSNPLGSALVYTSPMAALEIAGVILASSAAAAWRIPAPGPVVRGRRQMFWIGMVLALGTAAAESWLGPYWAQAVRHFLAG